VKPVKNLSIIAKVAVVRNSICTITLPLFQTTEITTIGRHETHKIDWWHITAPSVSDPCRA
jgi:hypothetical protein